MVDREGDRMTRMSFHSCSILKHITEQDCLLYVAASTQLAWEYAVMLLNK